MRASLRWFVSLGIIAGLVLLWQGLVVFYDIPHWKLPAPWEVAKELWYSKGLLASHTWITVQEMLLGLLAALVAGLTLATIINMSRTLGRVVYPVIIAAETFPIIIMAPLLLIWVGYGIEHKVIVVALIAFFPVVINTADGLRAADPDLLSLMRTMGANRWQLFTKVQIPNALPFMFSGIKLAATVSVIGAVIGEWVGSSEGLGYLAMVSKGKFLFDRVYAVTFLFSLLGMSMFVLVGLLERALLPWHHGQKREGALE
jgi:ABC-type nitrate/sulfonate/bicarbonate transport system permease component